MLEDLEKEIEVKADEYALEESNDCDYGSASKHVYQGCFNGFKEGAKFIYDKMNEWHYVKDGDLPKGLPKPVQVLFHNKLSDKIVVDIARYSLELNKWWFIHDLKDLEEDVIAWKEIVLPEEADK